MRTVTLSRALGSLFLLVSTAVAQLVVPYDLSSGEVPVGIAVDKTGNVWVSLQDICQLRRYTPDFQESLRITLFGVCPAGTGTGGLAVDAKGNLYVTVVGAEEVRGVYVVDRSGSYYRMPGTEQIQAPNSIAFDHHNGTMYITEMIGGAIWRIEQGGVPELWIQHPTLVGVVAPESGIPFPIGANGIAVRHKTVYVSVTFLPSLVAIPIEKDGSAGTPSVLVSSDRLFAMGYAALDDVALDVLGNIYVSVVAAIMQPPTVLRVSPDGTRIESLGPMPAAVTTIAFGTGRSYRKTLFAGLTAKFGGSGSGIMAVNARYPGLPLP